MRLMIAMPHKVLDFSSMEKGTPQYETIRGHYLFSGLNDNEFETLAAEISVESYEKGEIPFHRGDDAGAFFFVESGQFELSLISRDGQKKVVEVIADGRTFAEAIIFMPLLYIAAYLTNPDVLPTAAILTLGLFGGLTATVFITKKDFSFLRTILSVGMFIALGFVVPIFVTKIGQKTGQGSSFPGQNLFGQKYHNYQNSLKGAKEV